MSYPCKNTFGEKGKCFSVTHCRLTIERAVSYLQLLLCTGDGKGRWLTSLQSTLRLFACSSRCRWFTSLYFTLLHPQQLLLLLMQLVRLWMHTSCVICHWRQKRKQAEWEREENCKKEKSLLSVHSLCCVYVCWESVFYTHRQLSQRVLVQLKASKIVERGAVLSFSSDFPFLRVSIMCAKWKIGIQHNLGRATRVLLFSHLWLLHSHLSSLCPNLKW